MFFKGDKEWKKGQKIKKMQKIGQPEGRPILLRKTRS
jgi:hypothetical protein